jgi:hypothetical protein
VTLPGPVGYRRNRAATVADTCGSTSGQESSPDKVVSMKTHNAAVAMLAIAALTFAACGSSDDDNGAEGTTEETTTSIATTDVPTTTVSVTTTTDATTTTVVATTTTEPDPQPTEGVRGIVWASAVSDDRINADPPAPTFEVDGIVSTIESVLHVQAGNGNDLNGSAKIKPSSARSLTEAQQRRNVSSFSGDSTSQRTFGPANTRRPAG